MPRNKVGVIITSAGTASAVSVIKALKQQQEVEIHIVAVDRDPLAPGLYLADEHHLVPEAKSAEYIPALIELSRKCNANLLIPIYSKEIAIVAANSGLLQAHGIQTFLPDPGVIELCNNKEKMAEIASLCGVKIPKHYQLDELTREGGVRFPLFVKPNTGSSSSGSEVIATETDLKRHLQGPEGKVFQECISADEATVDVFCDADSEPLVISPRLRLATKSGQSVKGITIDSGRFKMPIQRICRELGIVGACNFQFFIKDQELIFIELNPRFAAGGLMLTCAAGANIPLVLLKSLLNLPVDVSDCTARVGYTMTRYWEEIILEPK